MIPICSEALELGLIYCINFELFLFSTVVAKDVSLQLFATLAMLLCKA